MKLNAFTSLDIYLQWNWRNAYTHGCRAGCRGGSGGASKWERAKRNNNNCCWLSAYTRQKGDTATYFIIMSVGIYIDE